LKINSDDIVLLNFNFKLGITYFSIKVMSSLISSIRQSGSSVRGRSRSSKIGNQKLRNLLFMCSFNACKYNKACKAIYDRIVAKSQRKKLALTAVCNKLLKQAFAISKSGLIYDDTYRSTLVKN
jgi:transposase